MLGECSKLCPTRQIMASTLHLHHEAKVMQVREHNELLSIQFLLGAHKGDRPDHRTTEQPPAGMRKVSQTLLSNFGPWLTEHFGDLDGLDEGGYRTLLANIHEILAGEAATGYTPPVWPEDGVGRPVVNEEEERRLPRSTRCTLAQLRSGYSRILNNHHSGEE